MARGGAHGVVGDSRGVCAAEPAWVGEEGIEASVAAVIEVDVDATVVGEDEVADCVGALDGLCVGVERGEKPRVLGCNQGAGLIIGPELWGRESVQRCPEGAVRPHVREGKDILYTHNLHANPSNSSALPSNALVRYR